MNDLNGKLLRDADLDRLGWHDCSIHGMAFALSGNEIRFDIDFISEWPSALQESFMIAPATLAFDDVASMSCQLQPVACDIWIRSIQFREEKRQDGSVNVVEIQMVGGSFRAEYRRKCLFFRGPGVRVHPPDQRLSFEQRQGAHFDMPPWDG